jgi:peptidoglycan-associated lipoprotein
MISRRRMLVLASALSLGALGACRHKIEPTTTPTPSADAGMVVGDAAAARRADSLAAADLARRRADSIAAASRAAANNSVDAQRAQAEMLGLLRQRVYFDYDRDNLRDDAVAILDGKAAILLANPDLSLTITGHTDERGTAEYNLALGQRRAAQVKRYLASKGIGEGRLVTQSLGDSQPAVAGTDESAYQQNRRAEFVVGNLGAAPLVRPRS